MNIEVKNSIKPIDYEESMKILEKRVEGVHKGKKNELLWILEHYTVYTAGTSSNEKDLIDMPKKIIDDIKITPVEYADQVIKIALTKELKPTEWVEVDIAKKDDKSQASIQ